MFVRPEDYIRFHPFVNPARSSGNISLTIQAWDGSSMDTACTGVLDNNSKSQTVFMGEMYLLYVLL